MNFIGDESLESRLIAVARNDGHFVHSIYESNRGTTDLEVLRLSLQMGLPIVTNDKDFGELVFRGGQRAFGVVLLRFPSYVPTLQKAEVFLTWLRTNGEMIEGHYVVLTPNSARVRGLQLD